jgi:hypothetical protein
MQHRITQAEQPKKKKKLTVVKVHKSQVDETPGPVVNRPEVAIKKLYF